MNPYGTWASPISADAVTAGVVRLAALKSESNSLFWLEQRPAENGRTALVRHYEGKTVDLTPSGFSVRSQVHEYGGGAYTVAGQWAFFVNANDQNIYRVDIETPAEPVAITHGGTDVRFAALVPDPVRPRLIAIRERHPTDELQVSEAVNDLVAIDVESGVIAVLHEGHDFYASPALPADGSKMAFLAWDHPNMPWDGTQLFVGECAEDGRLVNATVIAGGADESVFQPEWLSPDRLIFACDANGFWNLHSYDRSGIYCVAEDAAEFGMAQWQFDMHSFAILDERFVVATRIENNREELVIVDVNSGLVSPLDDQFSSYGSITAVPGGVGFIAGRPNDLASACVLDTSTRDVRTVHRAGTLDIEPGFLSEPNQIAYRNRNGETVFAHLYMPNHPTALADAKERPPLLVLSHGGPTSRSSRDLDLRVQFYSSRGWAVLDVDYGGSSGFGRMYRMRLDNQWGITDVEDCVAGVRHLVAEDKIDPSRVAIRGGSAGGYTTLQALVTSNVFGAGASHYGVGDLNALARDTHKFESRYLDGLIGDAMDERSPINHVAALNTPVLFLQGSEDRVVPPNQAETMFEALCDKGLPVGFLLFEGEGHGFREANHIIQAVKAEYLFFARVFGFEPADNNLGDAFEGARLENVDWI